MRELVDMLAITAQTGPIQVQRRDSRGWQQVCKITRRASRLMRVSSITTDYLVNQIASDDLASVQTTYLTALESFVQTFPTSPASGRSLEPNCIAEGV